MERSVMPACLTVLVPTVFYLSPSYGTTLLNGGRKMCFHHLSCITVDKHALFSSKGSCAHIWCSGGTKTFTWGFYNYVFLLLFNLLIIFKDKNKMIKKKMSQLPAHCFLLSKKSLKRCFRQHCVTLIWLSFLILRFGSTNDHKIKINGTNIFFFSYLIFCEINYL